MDNTIRNATDLQRALADINLSTSNHSDNSEDVSVDYHPNTEQNPQSLDNLPRSSSKARTSTDKYSTNALLYNLSGLQTGTNSKLEALLDATIRLQKTLQNMNEEQKKQTEILAMIARNTSVDSQPVSSNTRQSTNNRQNGASVQIYGFKNSKEIVSELIIKLLKQVEIKVSQKGQRYRSTRIMLENMMVKAVETVCDAEFKDRRTGEIRKPIKMPDNKNPNTIYLASRIGSIDDLSPILSPEILRELFDNPDCRAFMSIVQDIIERLCIVGVIIPFYESDMLKAISFPYFDKSGELICDWNKINKREETPDENLIMNASITHRKKIGTMIAKGISQKAAINAVIKN